MAASASLSTPIIQAMPNLLPNAHATGGPGAALNSWMTAAGAGATGASSSSSASATLSASSVLLPQQLLQASQPIPKMPLAPLPTSTNPSQQSVTPLKTEGSSVLPQSGESNRPSSYVDAEGYRIWICPACGKVDDGSPMIGCDGCDAWYHW